MYNYLFIIILCVKISSQQENTTAMRDGRFIPFWWSVGFVRFENGICTSADGQQGTCYTRRQCDHVGGYGVGSCASGIGVCCVVQNTCGTTTSNNNTYFVNPGFPNTYAGGTTCTLSIQRCNSDICQIRIDFLTFNLAQPNADGVCINDALSVVGGASLVPVICGDNSGQHMYVDFNGDDNIQIIINTNTLMLYGRSWNIKIAQIGCDCRTRAPSGCLQYYTAASGSVRSFNYGTTTNGNDTRQLVNENYGVCVEMLPGYCSITWSECGTNSFDVTDSMPFQALSDGNCTTDFVVIPNAYDTATQTMAGDRFCGTSFMSVTTFSKPFVLTVVTNGDEVDDISNTGFCLSYSQRPCIRNFLNPGGF